MSTPINDGGPAFPVSQLEVKGAKQALMKKFRELMKKKRQ